MARDLEIRAAACQAESRRTAAQVMKEYDFSKAKGNPYARRLKRQVTIRLDQDTVTHFKKQALVTGVAYQTLINLYLRDCASRGRRLRIRWTGAS
jgi:uncharacterized protein (DUF4415 family)